MIHEIAIKVRSLRHLPQQFFHDEKQRAQALGGAAQARAVHPTRNPGQSRSGDPGYRRCLRAQASIANRTAETGNSVWGKVMKSREATWLRGNDTLSWRMPEQQFKQVKAYTPVCKVYIYAADPSAPTMETSDAVGWFIVDMRDLSSHQRKERWVKLQGSSPAEVLISTSLAMAREADNILRQPPPPHEDVDGADTIDVLSPSVPAMSPGARSTEAMQEAAGHGTSEAPATPTGVAVLATPAAEAVSELDALPVGPGADGDDARIFSLSISVKGAARLSELASRVAASAGEGFWFSYSIFGVVVQTERFERLVPLASGDGPVLEPMLDSFRLRATLQGLCKFLAEAPPLQVYLCTEGRILAHADVNMSLLLQQEHWASRRTLEFGRSGMEGDIVLRLPGETDVQRDAEETKGHHASVVTICAELTAGDARPGDSENSVIDGRGRTGAEPSAAEPERETTTPSGVRTWALLASKRRVDIVTAVLQRIELKPLPRGTGPSDSRRGGILVGIRAAEISSPSASPTEDIETLSSGVFHHLSCEEHGEVNVEDSAFPETISWQWKGDLCESNDGMQADSRGRSGTLSIVSVRAASGEQREIAAGVVPWPSSALSGRQHVNVTLISSDGTGEEVGSCRVRLEVLSDDARDVIARDGDDVHIADNRTRAVADVQQTHKTDAFEVLNDIEEDSDQGDVKASNAAGSGRSKSAMAKTVQVEQSPLEGPRDETEARTPRSYRMSINLASVNDLENAAYMVASYQYPHFGTSAPVRTSLVWAAPRMDTPLANSCCTFSFGMSLNRLSAIVRERKLVVSLRNKDRFREEEIGLVTLPLEDVVDSEPQYFRCRQTNKTFTSMAGFKGHLRARQRSQDNLDDVAQSATPVQVKVVDRYLTVASTSAASSSHGDSGQPTRLCSLRVILMLEDLGPTGEAYDEVTANEELHHASETQSRELPSAPASRTQKLVVPSTVEGMIPAAGDDQGSPMPARLENLRAGQSAGGADIERVWREWERWRLAEETSFARRLREKDQALEEKWDARERARRRDVAKAQADYAKLEGKLRKALGDVEARERALKSREESWKADHAHKLSELQLLQRRLKEETKHQVELERMKSKALEKQLSSQSKALELARARVVATDEDLERYREQQRKTPEGGLRQELFRLGAAKAEAEAQVERERSLRNKALLEKEEYRAHIHKLARALKRHQERESTCARREMEQLRLEYLAREERFMLDGDRNELRTIKQELDDLRHVSLIQEAQAGLKGASVQQQGGSFGSATVTQAPQAAANVPSNMQNEGLSRDLEPSPSPPPRPTPAPAHVSVRWDGVSASRDAGTDVTRRSSPRAQRFEARERKDGAEENEVERLREWRTELLGTGMYTEQNPIVSELNRRIALAQGRKGVSAEGTGWQE